MSQNKQKVRVLHVTHTNVTKDSRILKEMECLVSSDLNCSVYGIGIESRGASDAGVSKKGNVLLRLISLKSRRLNFLPKIFRHILSYVEASAKILFYGLKYRPKIIHSHDQNFLLTLVILKLICRSKLVYDAHELESDKNGATFFSRRLALYTEKVAWPFISSLIVVSPSILGWYQSKFKKKPSEVILNAPVLNVNSDCEIDKNYLRQKYNIPDDSRIFIYIGGFMRGRGVSLILEAFQNSSINSHVVFLGYGYMKEELLDVSRRCPRVHVHDRVPHEQVVSVAKSADIGLCLIENVSLSDYYCLPNKLFEYCFSGVPILASNFPDIISLIENFSLGRYCDLNVDDLIKSIKSFEEMPVIPEISPGELYEISWDAQKTKIISLYSKLLCERCVIEIV